MHTEVWYYGRRTGHVGGNNSGNFVLSTAVPNNRFSMEESRVSPFIGGGAVFHPPARRCAISSHASQCIAALHYAMCHSQVMRVNTPEEHRFQVTKAFELPGKLATNRGERAAAWITIIPTSVEFNRRVLCRLFDSSIVLTDRLVCWMNLFVCRSTALDGCRLIVIAISNSGSQKCSNIYRVWPSRDCIG